jgi:hypothetical protein
MREHFFDPILTPPLVEPQRSVNGVWWNPHYEWTNHAGGWHASGEPPALSQPSPPPHTVPPSWQLLSRALVCVW